MAYVSVLVSKANSFEVLIKRMLHKEPTMFLLLCIAIIVAIVAVVNYFYTAFGGSRKYYVTKIIVDGSDGNNKRYEIKKRYRFGKTILTASYYSWRFSAVYEDYTESQYTYYFGLTPIRKFKPKSSTDKDNYMVVRPIRYSRNLASMVEYIDTYSNYCKRH